MSDEKKVTNAAEDAARARKEARKAKSVKPKRPPFYVCDGKSITTKRGVISDGGEIMAKDLSGGKTALEAFISSGYVGKA